jgi:hypothetical integral membrane protein (TIGR02206 family)
MSFDAFWGTSAPPFRLFGPTHLIALTLVIAVNVSLFFWRGPSEDAKRRFRIALAAALLVDEALLHLWYVSNGLWTPQLMLPFHLCAALIYLSAAMLLTRHQRLYEFCYLLGVSGATQALLTPDTPYEFPCWRFISMFVSHGSIVTAALYMTVVEGFRPTWASLPRALLALGLYAIPVYALNSLIGSNYLFINGKPTTASLIDALPAWPWYLPILGVIAAVMMTLIYLPFAVKDWRALSKQTNQAAA